MNYEIGEIDEIAFNFLSKEEIVDNSVCEIFESKLEGPNSLYDPRMGLHRQSDKCPTCHDIYKGCPGHFGHINLNEYLIHPACHKIIMKLLTIQCTKCYGCTVKKEQLKLDDGKIFKKKARIDPIYKVCSNIDVCQNERCREKQPKYFKDGNNICFFYKKKTAKTTMKLNPIDIYNRFKKMDANFFKLLGIDLKNKNNHPCNFIISALPVSPPCVRPPVEMGEMCHDDLTFKYVEIVKVNNKLKDTTDTQQYQELLSKLEFHVYTLFDNSSKKAKQHSGKPINAIKQRLVGKAGRIRGNLCGKRVDFTGRTVIGPDPSLPYDVIVMPPTIAQKFTKPEIISKLNIDDIMILINNGKCNYLFKGGDIDSNPYNLKVLLKSGGFKLQEGDKVERIINTLRCDKKCKNGLCDIHKNRKDVEMKYMDKCNFIYVKTKIIDPYKFKLMKGKDIEVKEGDKVIRGKEIITNFNTNVKKFCDKTYKITIDKITVTIELGDIVERQLMDEDAWKKLIPNSRRPSDRVTINRQPSLHIGSIMSFKIKILPGSTMRVNLAITGAFNADQINVK